MNPDFNSSALSNKNILLKSQKVTMKLDFILAVCFVFFQRVKLRKRYYFILNFFYTFITESLHGSCDILQPSPTTGLVEYLDDCPKLLTIFNKSPMFDEDIKLLTSRQRGKINNKYVVCCEVENLLPTAPACGIEFADRIIGGRNTTIYEYPWTALMQYTYRKFHHFVFHGLIVISFFLQLMVAKDFTVEECLFQVNMFSQQGNNIFK